MHKIHTFRQSPNFLLELFAGRVAHVSSHGRVPHGDDVTSLRPAPLSLPAALHSGKPSSSSQWGKMADVQPPPLRPLDDFLLSSARFAVPDVRNLDRWNNRVINNLLYYQSNYFLSVLLFLLLVG